MKSCKKFCINTFYESCMDFLRISALILPEISVGTPLTIRLWNPPRTLSDIRPMIHPKNSTKIFPKFFFRNFSRDFIRHSSKEFLGNLSNEFIREYSKDSLENSKDSQSNCHEKCLQSSIQGFFKQFIWWCIFENVFVCIPSRIYPKITSVICSRIPSDSRISKDFRSNSFKDSCRNFSEGYLGVSGLSSRNHSEICYCIFFWELFQRCPKIF